MSKTLVDTFRNTVAGGLKRKAVTTCAKWAQTYRVMPPLVGIKPFKHLWTPDPAPWTLEMHNSVAALNVGQKSAQMGYTETVLNVTLFKIDIENLDCLYILPTKMPDASEFSAARFDSALELSPHLQNLFSNVRNVGHKRAGSANLYLRGSNSRSALKSIPVAFIVFDEVDEMNQENIPLAEERTSGRQDPQIWKISTPTIPNKGINKVFQLSTQEHYFFKCPHCSRKTELIWPDSIIVMGEYQNDPKIKESYLICKECKHALDHRDKMIFLAPDNSEWVPENPTSDIRGFYINQLYSIMKHPSVVVEKFFDGQVDKSSEQEFFNSKMGLPHIVEGARISEKKIEAARSRGTRRKDHDIPTNKIITMGIDQGRWLYYEIAAWHFEHLGNDLNMSAKCEVLTEGKCVDFDELDQLMRQYQILKVVIDAQPDRRKAYEFACKYWGHVMLCFYARGQQGKTISIDPDEDQHKITVDRTSWLDVALNRFNIGSISLPIDLSLDYITHIPNLIKHYKVDNNGNPTATYVTVGPDHLAHARCYNEIALPLAASLQTNQNVKVFL